MLCPGAFQAAAPGSRPCPAKERLGGTAAGPNAAPPAAAAATGAGCLSSSSHSLIPVLPWRWRPWEVRRRVSPAAAASASQRPPGALAATSPAAQVASKGEGGAVPVKIIGVGSRGASALSKLVQHGKVSGAELWCLDVDKKVVDRVPNAQQLLLPKEGSGEGPGQGPLSQGDLLRIVGRGASDAGGRGNIGSGDGGLAFVVAPAAAVPGGPQVLMQLVAALRAAGHFTVVALTQPFEFEGVAKAEQASKLVAALRASAHLVAVMEQDVLMQAFGDSQLTVAEATDIADNALEHTVRAVLQAVQAREVLKSSRGALMWHGRDLRHYRRLLSPPLQQLLGSSGTAVLGRGLATMPGEVAHSMGAPQALMHLASDAVRAAAESPFLDGALEKASGVLCCLTLPPSAEQFRDEAGSSVPLQALQSLEGERHATRMAVQAAAGALTSITGAECEDFVMCAEPRLLEAAAGGSGKVEVEATLLILRGGSEGGSATSAPLPAAGNVVPRMGPSFTAAAPPQLPSDSDAEDAAGGAAPGAQRQRRPGPQQQPQRLPPTAWNALSAMAGGAPAPNTQPASRAPPPQRTSQQAQQQLQDAGAGNAARASGQGLSFFQGGASGSGSAAAAPQQQPKQQQGAAARRGAAGGVAGPAAGTAAGGAASRSPAGGAGKAGRQQQQPPQPKLLMGDYLADSLTAQSLDLPPAAARWRQAQRASALKQNRLVVWDMDPGDEEEEGVLSALLGGQRKERRRPHIRDRANVVLQQDREEAWLHEDDEQGGGQPLQ